MKKIVSLILSLVMLMSITSGLNLTAYAETYGDFEYSHIEDDFLSIRYIVIVILLLINIIFFIRLKSKNITTSVIMIILSIIFLFISYNANKVLNIINNFSNDKDT